MILSNIHGPDDLKNLSPEQRIQLCEELRDFVQEKSKAKAGHIKSSLGVTELTLALHTVLHTPEDILIWDVGHQAYIHKILTGRRSDFARGRTRGGISGFTRSSESAYDPFGAGHSSTSVSALCGFAEADLLRGRKRRRVAVIGDGAFTGGMNFEALNYLGERQLDVLIVLNDNRSSIDENVGALNHYQSYARLCEAMGIKYLDELDGHDVNLLSERLEAALAVEGPRLIRVHTQKGRGFHHQAPGQAFKPEESFQSVFGDEVLQLAEQYPQLVVISPAMLSGASLMAFKQRYPERTFDVGIAEQHAVTMAAGMAAAGSRPLVHLYSTFSQRAYDQIIHDVALQNLPVTFVLDRAGLAGEDGATHHGAYDVSFLQCVPNLRMAAPYDGASLRRCLQNFLQHSGPMVIRYPKGVCGRLLNPSPNGLLKVGSVKAVVSYGSIAQEVEEALEGLPYAHFVLEELKPLREEEWRQALLPFEKVITVEENSLKGGMGSEFAAMLQRLDLSVQLSSFGLPDRFIQHGTRQELLLEAGLDVSTLRERFSGA